MKNKEIEVKFVINSKIKNRMISDLQSEANFIGENWLVDTYYIPDFKDFEVGGETVECVRIRENEKGCKLTYKKIHKESKPVYCDEFETFVSDKNQMENILFALGFSVQMVIDKTRKIYQKGTFEFDFDDVKGLGQLLEVELKGEDDINKIYDYVSKYGLSEKDVTREGIQTMMKKATKK